MHEHAIQSRENGSTISYIYWDRQRGNIENSKLPTETAD